MSEAKVRFLQGDREGLGFSLMMSVRNLAIFGSDWAGSTALDKYHFLFSTLVIANTLTTLCTVPLVLVLPKILIRHKDTEAPIEPVMPKSMPQI